MTQPTENEQFVIDLYKLGMDEWQVIKKLDITYAEYVAWLGGLISERSQRMVAARKAYRETQERLPREERAAHATKAIQRLRRKTIDGKVDRIIRESQKEEQNDEDAPPSQG